MAFVELLLAICLVGSVVSKPALGDQPAAKFPIILDTGEQVISGGIYESTHAQFSKSGILDLDVHIFDHRKASGTTGGVVISLEDDDNNKWFVSDELTQGIDGEWTGTSDRHVYYHFAIPPDAWLHTTKIAIIEVAAPHARWDSILNSIDKLAVVVGDVGKAIHSFSGSSSNGGGGSKSNSTLVQGIIAEQRGVPVLPRHVEVHSISAAPPPHTISPAPPLRSFIPAPRRFGQHEFFKFFK